MKVIDFSKSESETEAWLNWRAMRSTGSKLKKLLSKKGPVYSFNPSDPSAEVYSLIAAGLIGTAAIIADEMSDESDMDRGTRLEPESIDRLIKETGKSFIRRKIGWERDDDTRSAFSPDAYRGVTEAAESKSLSAKNHTKALLTREIPEEHRPQTVKAFMTNEKLRKLYFCFYDPRFPKGLDFFYLIVKRKDIKEEIEAMLTQERAMLKFVREKTNELSNLIEE